MFFSLEDGDEGDIERDENESQEENISAVDAITSLAVGGEGRHHRRRR